MRCTAPADSLTKASLPAPSCDANVVDKIDYTPDSDQDDTKERLAVFSIKPEKNTLVILKVCIIIAIPSCHTDYLASHLQKSAEMDQPPVVKRVQHPHLHKQSRPLTLQSPMWTYQLGPIRNGMQFSYLYGSNSWGQLPIPGFWLIMSLRHRISWTASFPTILMSSQLPRTHFSLWYVIQFNEFFF